MPSDRVSQFLAAKRLLRVHPDWDDEQVAAHLGIPPILIPDVVAPARTEIENEAG